MSRVLSYIKLVKLRHTRLRLGDIMPVKTIKNRFKTVDEAVDFLLESQARTAEFQAKTAESQAKTDLAIQRLSESQDRTDLAIQKLSESQDKTDLALQRLSKTQDETDLIVRRVAETVDKLSEQVKEVLTGFSTIGNRFGELVEFLVVPGLRLAINKRGHHNFKRSMVKKKWELYT